MVYKGKLSDESLSRSPVQQHSPTESTFSVSILPCCVKSRRTSLLISDTNSCVMGAEQVIEICEGVLDKKVDHRRLPIGPTWKRKYGVLSSDALRLYRSKAKRQSRGLALRTVPLCHIKCVSRLHEDIGTGQNYFNLETEQGETMTFRCTHGTGWVAQIQIQLIHYKNRQDIMRYKQLNNSMAVAENAMQRLRDSTPNHTQNSTTNTYVKEPMLRKSSGRDCRTVILPNHSGIGIGITVIPLNDGKVVVNRVLDGGPAMRMGVISPRDQILSANGHRVTSVEMLSEVVRNSPKTVTLIVKPRICKPSPTFDDPKRFINSAEDDNPDYINTTAADPQSRLIFEKGYEQEKIRVKHSPQHFRFT